MSNYIELLKTALTGLNHVGRPEYKPVISHRGKRIMRVLVAANKLLGRKGFAICKIVPTDYDKRYNGKDWPLYADTMIGMERMTNIEDCLFDVLDSDIPGNIIETGAWRGGACILMNAILDIHPNGGYRTLYVADSFEGLPKPDGRYEADNGDRHHEYNELSVSLEEVKANFQKYNLLTPNVKFLKGWFKDTLPTIPEDERFALIRLDGDMYGSTMDALIALYPKLLVGGYCIIDDYGAVPGCKQAVSDYRSKYGITEPIEVIDWGGVYWRKTN